MKKVVRGRVYDTSTAKYIFTAHGGAEFSNDIFYWEEDLYRKKTGEYFLRCYGGACTEYAEHYGTTSTSGEIIKTLT